jgi:hypothetical protein
MTSMRAVRLLFVIMAPACAPAADVTMNDIRADFGLLVTSLITERTLETTPSGGGPSTTAKSRDEQGMGESRAGLQWVTGTLDDGGGFIYGAQFAARAFRYGDGPDRTRVRGPVIDLLAGYAVAPLTWLHVEVTPFAGAGYDILRIDGGGGAPSVDNQSIYLEYGGRVGLYATLDGCWQVGLELPFVIGHARPKYAYTDAAGDHVVATETRTTRSTGAMLGLGVRF